MIKSIETNKVIAVFYLFNRKGDLVLNSYLRETFFVMGLRIENYFEKKEIADYADVKDDENENILALSNMFIYRVDGSYNVTYTSRNMNKIFPKMKVGELCYKSVYDRDKPCRDCPLRNFKRRVVDYEGIKYEISGVLNDRKSNERSMVVRQLTDEFDSGDLFNNNLLVYSYKSLVNAIKNEYASGGRGYLVLLRIDNYEKFIEGKGSEAYDLVIRNYVRNIKNKLSIDDIYFYNPTTLAIHFPYLGHADIINKIEAIYEFSKMHCLENFDDELNITYLPVGYPRGYAYAQDYLKHVSDFYHQPHEANMDFIYFADFDIARSANKRDFIVSVVENEFSGDNFSSMNLQPIVRVNDRNIVGAEILLRINDSHRNIFFNAAEISQIAAQENLTHLITESTINFVGNLFKEYGNTTFKINKFNRIAINVDQTYINDQNLIKNVIKLVSENHLPKGFISMEIPEDLIPHYFEGIKEFARQLSHYNILFSCDRYTGHYVSVEKLKELGFNEVKFARDIIMSIDKDVVKLSEFKLMVNQAKELNFGIAAVGVENATQFKLLKELDPEMLVQGYYLYKPLTRSDLISALIAYQK